MLVSPKRKKKEKKGGSSKWGISLSDKICLLLFNGSSMAHWIWDWILKCGALPTDAANKKWEILPPTSDTWYWFPALGELLQSRQSGNSLRYLDFIFFVLVRLSYYLSLQSEGFKKYPPPPFYLLYFLIIFLRCNTLQYLSFNNCVPYTIKDKIFTSILWEGQHYSQVKDPEMFWWAGYYSFLYSMWSCGIILQTIRQNRVIRPMGKAGKIWNLSVDRKCSCHFTRSKEWDTEFDSRNSNFSWS